MLVTVIQVVREDMISIITPVLNEEGTLPGYLSHIDGLAGDFEVIVVDGGSSDGTFRDATAAASTLRHRFSLLSSPKGRGVQMNAGAEQAAGSILLFLHADCRIPHDSLQVIEQACAEAAVIGGGFSHSFDSTDPFLRLTSFAGNILARRRGIFFGDFGIFIEREAFFRIGGYEPLLYLEDFAFSRAARRYGRLVRIDRTIRASPRRYAAVGKYRLSALYLLVLLLNAVGIRPESLVRYIVEK